MVAYMLKTVHKDMTAYGGFVWPESGPVECPDWDSKKECGNGLHGALWGEGDGRLFHWHADNVKWIVARIDDDVEIVDLGGKVKVPRCIVVHCGDQKSATEYLASVSDGKRAIIGRVSCVGDYATSTSGDCGTSTSGKCGISTSGDYATSTSGDCGTSTSGKCGISTSGDYGTSISGDCGTSVSGYNGIIRIHSIRENRFVSGNIGENGLKPNVAYMLDSTDNFFEA